MIKKKILLILLSLFFVKAIVAQEASPEGAGSSEKQGTDSTFAEVSLGFANTYYWRGSDIYAGKFAQDGKGEALFNDAIAVMPDITFLTPIEGLTFDLWMSYALVGRSGVDGLESVDEIDVTIDYSYEHSTKGSFSGGLILYVYPTIAGGNYAEFYLSYSLPVALNPTVSYYVADANIGSSNYLTASIDHEFEITSSLALAPSLLFGTWQYPSSSGDEDEISHLDLNLPLGFGISDDLSISFETLLSYRFLSDDSDDSEGSGDEDKKPELKLIFFLGVSYSL